MDDDDELECVPLEPMPFSVHNAAIHVCCALAGIADCVSDMFSGIAREFGHAANHRFERWKAKDEGEKFAAEVMQTIGGLDSQG